MPPLDMNMNMNMAFGSVPTAGRMLRPRFNSDVESRLATLVPPSGLVPPEITGGPPNYPPFHKYWDADLQAYLYLDDFLGALERDAVSEAVAAAAAVPGATAASVANAAAAAASSSWRTRYAAVAQDSGANKPPQQMSQNELGGDVLQILELALEREDRFAEVLDQDDADGAINYWLGMLKIDPARHPATNLMVHVARRIGEHVVMCLKGDFASPRPSQLCQVITPMIDPPVTPSFPAGHAVQSYLISLLLAYSFADAAGTTKLPQTTLPAANSSVATFLTDPPAGPLFQLAQRVSENRIVAGVHYPTDINAGKIVAIQAFKDIQKVATIWGPMTAPATALRDEVRTEFPQYTS